VQAAAAWQAAGVELAETALDAFATGPWYEVANGGRDMVARLAAADAALRLPLEVPTLIHTTNAIVRLHMRLRTIIKLVVISSAMKLRPNHRSWLSAISTKIGRRRRVSGSGLPTNSPSNPASFANHYGLRIHSPVQGMFHSSGIRLIRTCAHK